MSLNGIPWSAPRFWSSAQCNVRAQVFSDGRISFSHMPFSWTGTTFYGLKLNSNIKLRVAWENSNYPFASNQCNNLCEVVGSTCVCDTTVIKSAVFTDSKKIPAVSDILEKLKIGAADPASFDTGIYSIAYESEEQGLRVYVDSSKSFNENTIFEVRTVGSRVRYFANMKSSVSIKSAFSFRNPPNFMQHDERTVRDVQYEVDALLQHLLYHPSAAPFVADFLIKRFVTSNPTPDYVRTVSNAFMSGKYNGIGSGKYGDMASTFAAVLLYRDSISSAVKSDKYHGLMREPLLKIVHFMRALELRSTLNLDMDLYYFNNLIGQEAYFSPSVFNFYQSEFQPSGDIANSGLYAPEAQILNPPQTISYSNAMLNLVHMGLASCFETFGPSLRSDSTNCYYFQNLYPSGVLKYEDFLGSLSSSALIARLNTLLTGGRLDIQRRDIMQTTYESSFNRTSSTSTALKKVLSAFALTPEFQITNFAKSNFTAEKKKTPELSSSGGYKALVYVFLNGGMDSYNLLVPHSSCSGENLYDQYTSIRGTSALKSPSYLKSIFLIGELNNLAPNSESLTKCLF
jgi:cullin-associated NEDD8-dissociated protein 1